MTKGQIHRLTRNLVLWLSGKDGLGNSASLSLQFELRNVRSVNPYLRLLKKKERKKEFAILSWRCMYAVVKAIWPFSPTGVLIVLHISPLPPITLGMVI